MRPFQEALDIVLGQVRPLQEESVPLTAAYGRVLAVDIAAREDIPVADNSAMDGYAVRTADLPDEASCRERPLRVVEVLAADHLARNALKPGEAMKIMTGAPIPPGADAVVMVEHTRLEGGRVWIGKPPREGNHVRVAGGGHAKGRNRPRQRHAAHAGYRGYDGGAGICRCTRGARAASGHIGHGR